MCLEVSTFAGSPSTATAPSAIRAHVLLLVLLQPSAFADLVIAQ
jgi:hypothetical protein